MRREGLKRFANVRVHLGHEVASSGWLDEPTMEARADQILKALSVTTIRNLRARLQNDWREPRFIATVPGRGYRFLPTTAESAAATRAS